MSLQSLPEVWLSFASRSEKAVRQRRSLPYLSPQACELESRSPLRKERACFPPTPGRR